MEYNAEIHNDDEDSICFDPKLADALLAKDLNGMSVDERNIILEDIHGVRSPRVEEQNLVQLFEALEKMRIALEHIATKAAYDRARFLNSQYILLDKRLRIKFLRATEFDSQKAAQRFVDHLELIHELFGDVALMRPISLSDLSKDEENILKVGSIQLSPRRDRTGRRILVKLGYMGDPKGPEFTPSFMRIFSYILYVLSCDETTQKLGCVFVFCAGFTDGDNFFLKEQNIKENIGKFVASFPVRVSAIHFCLPDLPVYQIAVAALSSMVPMILRVRFRKHMGSHTEWKYSLMTHGIPIDELPITSSGRIKTTNHQRWIKFQREREDTFQMGLPPFKGVDCPRLRDILIGNHRQSPSFKNHPGNNFYRDVIDAYFCKYDAAFDLQERARVTWTVMEELERVGGRFLVRDKRGWWSVAGANKAREKIAHDFRETRKKKELAAEATASSKRRATHAYTKSSQSTANTFLFVEQAPVATPSYQKKPCLGRQQGGETSSAAFSRDSNYETDTLDESGYCGDFQ